jgi:integral membrane sensor domain MASE1
MHNIARFTEKMKKWDYCMGINILLAIGIFLCALLGRSLGIQGPALAISVVWPATGLSLAALLLYGNCAGVGIFVGNLAYNLYSLSAHPPASENSMVPLVLTATFITFGSVIQAFISAHMMRTFSTPLFFRTVQDIFNFLVPASLLACLVGSTIGALTLLISGGVDRHLVLPLWLTFWLGDTVGIYVMTPLIVIWTLNPQEPRFSSHIPSLLCMSLLFILLALATYIFHYPLPHLFVPISIWAAYTFRIHGASLAIFVMTAASIAYAAGIQGYEGTSLISLITFIGVTIAASLIIAAVVNERDQAWDLLNSRNLYLEKEVDVKVDVIDLIKTEVYQKRKLASLGAASGKLAEQIQAPLSLITKATNDSLTAVYEINRLFEEKKWTPEEKSRFIEMLNGLHTKLGDTLRSSHLISTLLGNLKP